MRRTRGVRCLAATLCLVMFCCAATAQAAPRSTMTSHVPKAVADQVAPLVGHLPNAQRLSLAISLPLRNQPELDDLLQQLYDPQSPSYHKYLSVQEFTERFGPVEADHAAVQQYAQANGLVVISIPPRTALSTHQTANPRLISTSRYCTSPVWMTSLCRNPKTSCPL